eukprot:4313-Heterococcus_DN1.PRE.1
MGSEVSNKKQTLWREEVPADVQEQCTPVRFRIRQLAAIRCEGNCRHPEVQVNNLVSQFEQRVESSTADRISQFRGDHDTGPLNRKGVFVLRLWTSPWGVQCGCPFISV